MGRVTNYTFDKLNRLEKIEYDGGANNPTPDLQATYTYDEISRLKTAANEAGTVSLNYDNRNRIKNTTDVFGHLIEYEYERTSTANQKHLKFDGAMYAVYNFDDATRLANIVNSSDNTTVSFGYDTADRLTSRNYPNGVTTTYEYDNMNRLERLKDVSSTATLFDREYGYNAANQISYITEPTQIRNFEYDNTDRLTDMVNSLPRPDTASPDKAATLTNEDYAYDNVGNRTSSHKSASYGYQPFNKLTSTATTTYKYDANGNMISKSEGSNFWRFNWDYENRLTTASTRKQTVRYLYDALGRRVQRHTKGTKENTKFIYDGQDVLVDDNSGVLTKYLNGEGIDNKLRMQTGSDVKYFLTDHLGSTNGLADGSGNLAATNSYDSFGNSSNSAFPTRYQFTGREYDSFTGLHYYRARFYDANLGRFISEDPIKFRGGINWFAYTENNPVNFKDPLGFCPTKEEPCNGQNNPKLWDKPQFGDGPYTNQNPFTSIEKGDVTSFWDDPFGTIGRAIPYFCYNFLGKGLFGDLGAGGAGRGIPGGGEMMNTLELGPDLYNTLDTVDRRNQDIDDALRCAQGDCSRSPYKKGNGLGGW